MWPSHGGAPGKETGFRRLGFFSKATFWLGNACFANIILVRLRSEMATNKMATSHNGYEYDAVALSVCRDCMHTHCSFLCCSGNAMLAGHVARLQHISMKQYWLATYLCNWVQSFKTCVCLLCFVFAFRAHIRLFRGGMRSAKSSPNKSWYDIQLPTASLLLDFAGIHSRVVNRGFHLRFEVCWG